MAFTAEIKADIASFENNLLKASSSLDKFSQKVGQQLNKVGDSFINAGKTASKFSASVAGVVTGIGALAISSSQVAKDLESMSVVTGVSVKKLQEFEHIATKATVPTDTLSTATLNLQRRLRDTSDEAGGATAILREMGVSLTNFDGSMKSAGQVTEDAIKAFAQLEDGIEKSSKGTQVFGGQWQNIAQIADLGADAIDQLSAEANELGLVLSDEAIASSAKFGIAVDVLKNRLGALKNQIGTALAPMLTDTLLPLIEEKVMPAFQSFANFVKGLIEKFNALDPATKKIIGVIAGLAIAIGPALLAIGGLLKILPLIGAGFTAVTGPIGIAIAAVAGAAILIIKNWDSIKEYFTSGGGSELFTEIKRLATNLFEFLKATFTTIKDVVIAVWKKMGDTITRYFGRVIDLVATIIKVFIKNFNNFIAIFTAGSLKGALSSFKNFFVEAFSGIWDIAKKTLSGLTELIGAFFRFIGATKIADTMQRWASSISPVVEKTEKQTKALEEQNEKLKENIQLVGNLSGISAGVGSEKKRDTGTQLGSVDSSGIADTDIWNVDDIGLQERAKATLDGVQEQLGAFGENVNTFSEDIAYRIGSTIENLAMGMANSLAGAIASGDNIIGVLASTLLNGLGSLAIEVGVITLGIGKAITSIFASLKNPLVTIGAGLALIALGVGLKAVAGVISARSSSAGTSGGYSSGGAGAGAGAKIDPTPNLPRGEFDIWGAYKEEVEFRISGDSLVGILSKKENKANRLN